MLSIPAASPMVVKVMHAKYNAHVYIPENRVHPTVWSKSKYLMSVLLA